MITLKVPNTAQHLLKIFLTVSFISGCLFFVLNTWVMVEGDFGPEKHPAQFTSLQIHAVSAFSIMVLYGAFWGSHVLYYVAHETFREFAMWIHLGVGLSLPVWLTFHIRAAKQAKRSQEVKKAKSKKPVAKPRLEPVSSVYNV